MADSKFKFKNAKRVDHSIFFSEDVVVEQVYCSDDCKTIFVLRVGIDTRVSFSIDGTNPNTVLKTLFGALRGFSLHSCIHEMVEFLRDLYNVKHINISYSFENEKA